MYRQISVFFTFITPFVAAQYPMTTSMLFLDTDPEPLVGSIIATSDSTTTYSITCAPGTDSDDCGIGSGATVTLGPTAYDFYLEEADTDTTAFAVSVHCQLSATVPLLCTVSAGGDDANDPGVATITPVANPSNGDYNGYTYLPIEITAGPAAGAVPVPATSAIMFTTTASGSVSSGGYLGSATTTMSTNVASTDAAITTTTITTSESGETSTSKVSAASYTGQADKKMLSRLVVAIGGILGASVFV